MPRRISAVFAALLLAMPAFAQEAETTTTEPTIILPVPEATDADAPTTPETVRPVRGSGCSSSKAVTS
ncbi:hypothetical protein [Paracoccus tegillarcae]|uniref:Uncharacterized protein n=1 Tax=Paracoccus tegillarcae TaxID=1529068 RepID=A0A2K9F3X5_9RHOB|nr:hypothetical protein [Paracoccus tegillarcae]AUH33831.1 hypothetical protein CUV01_10905 [Paracoccus tegillarcae]